MELLLKKYEEVTGSSFPLMMAEKSEDIIIQELKKCIKQKKTVVELFPERYGVGDKDIIF
jgi:hypothetical protein